MNAKHENAIPSYVPWDIEVAQINFGANCGPAVFATTTHRDVCRVMQYFPHFPRRPWTNLTQMLNAFEKVGYETNVERCKAPTRGLALIQWLGPWTEKSFFSRWSLFHTHWVAIENGWIFDHNACHWQTFEQWSQGLATELIAEVDRATGWKIKYGIEVTTEMQTGLDLLSETRPRNQFRVEELSRRP